MAKTNEEVTPGEPTTQAAVTGPKTPDAEVSAVDGPTPDPQDATQAEVDAAIRPARSRPRGEHGARPIDALSVLPEEGRARVVIEALHPEIDGGRHPAKAVAGEDVVVTATAFADGHDELALMLKWRPEGSGAWHEVPMTLGRHDRWRATFPARALGRYEYTVEGWIDGFKTWSRDLGKRLSAGQDVRVELRIGADLIARRAARTQGELRSALERHAALVGGEEAPEVRAAAARDPALAQLMARADERAFCTRYGKDLVVQADPARARFSAWYELFPRSFGSEPGRHGTLAELELHLPYVASLGFDTLYLPPIHPIGRTHRKGPNNRRIAEPGDLGSPWAIGSEEGGHKSVHPALGTVEDLAHLARTARDTYGIELALDVAFQCSPDHPYVKAHPEWFVRRPDGTIQYAENPPKKYEDIVPFNFETEDWRALWEELRSVFLFWIDQGVRTFRVDNPHTKSLRFWEWCIDAIKRAHPEVVFLAEAFTRPPLMYNLAKLGFSQSYTYFAWKNAKWELTQWYREVASPEVSQFYRPNLWPNTPDILNAFLQHGGRNAFMIRLLLAATLGPSWGIYGPAFELLENTARDPGSEEYQDSEKYQLRGWNLNQPQSLAPLITRINRIRRENPALHSNERFTFHEVDNEQILCFSKRTEDLSNMVVTIVNLDPWHRQSGYLELPLELFGMPPDARYQVHDMISDARFLWYGARNYVELDPGVMPGHVFRLHKHVRTEEDFEYYL